MILLFLIMSVILFVLLFKVMDLTSERNRFESRIKDVQKHMDTCKSINDRLNIEIQSLINENKELDDKVIVLDSELTQSIEKSRTMESKLAVAESKIFDYEQLSKLDLEKACELIVSHLYPNAVQHPLPVEFDKKCDYITLRNDLFRQLERVVTYQALMETAVAELKNNNYSYFVCTALSEALANKIMIETLSKNYDPTTIFPSAARIFAELNTMYEESQQHLRDWGNSQKRREEIEKIRVIRKNAEEKIEQATLARYQLDYLLDLYPDLQDVLDTSHSELEQLKPIDQINHADDSTEEYDTVRNYLSETEYERLSTTEKNQLALDRYVNEHRKTKWQIGRDYELYIGYLCEKNGASVEYTGSLLKLEDLGRDLIAKYQNTTYIIQCKYWSTEKVIHEKHIMQLFGSAFEYRLSHPTETVRSVFVTSTALSDVARKFADAFSDSMIVYENIPLGDFPRIKCNIGTEGKIYHLPMDLSYDKVKIDRPGEFLAFTVSEAENAGFRRSYKWHGSHE